MRYPLASKETKVILSHGKLGLVLSQNNAFCHVCDLSKVQTNSKNMVL